MLSLDLTTIIFEIINFLVLSVLLYRFLFQPVMHNVQKRTNEKAQIMQSLEHEHQQAADKHAEVEARLANIDIEVDAIRSEAHQEIAADRAMILEQAHQEAERILAEAHQDEALWRKQAINDFNDALLKTILDVSCEAIASVAPPELHDALVQELNDRTWELGRREIERVEAVRQSLGERVPTAYVTSAQALSPDQQTLLSRAFSALADRHVTLEQQTDAQLALGLKVRLGDILIDNSLSGQLASLRDTVNNSLEVRLIQETTNR